ncbi:MAG: hypothetical protein AAF267_25190 [Deinococcota bacterium]
MERYITMLQRYWHSIPVLGRFFVGIFLIIVLIFGRLPVFLAVPLLLLAVFITSYSGYQFLLASSKSTDAPIPDTTRDSRKSKEPPNTFDEWDED